MSAKQLLEKYILEHPEYWEFETEIKEVERLKGLCNDEVVDQNVFILQKDF
jgi:hypothetical protein